MMGLIPLVVVCGCKKTPATAGPAAGPATQVAAEPAKLQAIAETLAVVGTLAANEFVEVKSETDGTIAEILFNEGQPVKKGDLLLRLDESKFAASLAEAEANLKLTATTFERNKQLFREKLVSQQEYDQAASLLQVNQATVELRKRLLQDARIVAPLSGIVGARNISPGQVISKNTTLTWLIDLELVKAEFNVPERFLGEIKQGQPVELSVAAYPKQKFQGEVYFIAPQVDSATRTVLVKARIPNADHKLKPGMFANFDLTLTLRQDAIVIPESALMAMGERTAVYVVASDGTAQMRSVKIGLRTANQIEVVSGLEAGEKVIIEGLQKVRPGAPTKIMTPPANSSSSNTASAR
jgi:membrane fusion protein (multidrug efflux system)